MIYGLRKSESKAKWTTAILISFYIAIIAVLVFLNLHPKPGFWETSINSKTTRHQIQPDKS